MSGVVFRALILTAIVGLAIYYLYSSIVPKLACPGVGVFSTIVDEGLGTGQTVCQLTKDFLGPIDPATFEILPGVAYSSVIEAVPYEIDQFVFTDPSTNKTYFRPNQGKNDGQVPGDTTKGTFNWTDAKYTPHSNVNPAKQGGCPPVYSTFVSDVKGSTTGQVLCSVRPDLDTRDPMVNADIDLNLFMRAHGYANMTDDNNQLKFAAPKTNVGDGRPSDFGLGVGDAPGPDGWTSATAKTFTFTDSLYQKIQPDSGSCPPFAHATGDTAEAGTVICSLNASDTCDIGGIIGKLPYSGYSQNNTDVFLPKSGRCNYLPGLPVVYPNQYTNTGNGWDYPWNAGDGFLDTARVNGIQDAKFQFTPWKYRVSS